MASEIEDRPPGLLRAFVRGLGAVTVPEPRRAPGETVLGPDAPAGVLVGSALKGRLDDLVGYAALIRSRDEPEDTHRARATVRKLRAILRGFRSILDRRWADGLREELRWLADQLGAVRDIDVALNALRSRAKKVARSDAHHVAEALQPLLDARAPARERLVATLDGERYLRLLGDLENATVSPAMAEAATPAAGDVARDVLRKTSKRIRKALRRARAGVETNELHHARILARNGRYVAEACEPVGGKRARRLAQRLSRVQDALGAINDAAFIQERLRATVEGAGAQLVAGQLIALEGVEGQKARTTWKLLRRKALRDDWTRLK